MPERNSHLPHRRSTAKKIFDLANGLINVHHIPEYYVAEYEPSRPIGIVESEQRLFAAAVGRLRRERLLKRAPSHGALRVVPPPPAANPQLQYHIIETSDLTCTLQSYQGKDGLGNLLVGSRLQVFDEAKYLANITLTAVNFGRPVMGRDRLITNDLNMYTPEQLVNVRDRLQDGINHHYEQVHRGELDLPLRLPHLISGATPATIASEPDAPRQFRHLQVVPSLPPEA